MCLRRQFILGMIGCGVFVLDGCEADRSVEPKAASTHRDTEWELKPSLRFDCLCLLNALSGDPFYLAHYQTDYDYFNPLFTPEEQAAFRELKRIIKDESGGIVSAKLTLMFSALEGETLSDLIDSVRDSTRLRAAWRRTIYWDRREWGVYTGSIAPRLEIALRGLQRVGFEAYWEAKARPQIEKRMGELRPRLQGYNIVPAIESRLGKALPSNRITLYLLAYSEPHGIRICGARFITHVSYPFEIVIRNAIHEMMHPPYDRRSPAIADALARIGKDTRIQTVVKNHNKSYGYNDLYAYLEEDSVQALEAVVNEQLGIGRDPQEYWKAQDGGMHILAVAIYSQLKKAEAEGFTWQSYPDFLCAAAKRGDLTGDSLARTLERFWPAEK